MDLESAVGDPPPGGGLDILVVIGDLHLVIASLAIFGEPVVGSALDRARRPAVADLDLDVEDEMFGAVVAVQALHRGVNRGEPVSSTPPRLEDRVSGEDLVEFVESALVDQRRVAGRKRLEFRGILRWHRGIVARSTGFRKALTGDHYTHPVLESALIEAVHTDRVGEAAERSDAPEHRAIVDACRTIGRQLEATRREVTTIVDAISVAATVGPIPPFPQRYALEVTVDGLRVAEALGDGLVAAGFEPWEHWAGGARRSFERHGDHLSFARTDGATTVVRVRWRPPTKRTMRQRLTAPTPGDWHAVALPSWAWWAYPPVRLVRLLVERLSPRRRYAGSLGPFLTTPAELLDPLLDLVGADDRTRVIDLGCGDGRLVVAAAERGACAVGIESDPELVDRARRRAEEHGVSDRASFVIGDARGAQLDDVDVVFAFLPVEVVADLLPRLLPQMRAGAVLLVHEQNPLPDWVAPNPDASDLVVGTAALTVAHRWRRPLAESA